MASDYLVLTGIDNLCLLPSGPLPPNPAELLGSQRMAELIAELKTQADVVIFDSPPLLAAVDATVLARSCDAALIVVRAASTRTDALRSARDHLWQSGTRLLGVALNHVSISHSSYVYSYYHGEKRPRRRRFLRWHGLRLPFFHSSNGSRPGPSVTAVAAADSIKAPSDQTLYRNGNGSRAAAVEALAAPESAEAPSDRHPRNGNRGRPSQRGR